VHDAEDYACGEQDEFDGHTRQYTLSRVGCLLWVVIRVG
jgi:hypothetical protein